MNIDYKTSKKLNWWLLYEISVRKIQKQFRKWYYKRKYRIKYYVNNDKLNPKYPTFYESFQKIISESAIHEDKMSFWRGMIELRRNHKASSSDTMIRSLIDSNGDLSRSIVLLGTKAFLENNTNELPNKLKHIFLPYFESSENYMINNNNSNYHHPFIDIEYSRTNKINDIRSLKDQQRKVIKRKELFDILNLVIRKTYFSNIHHGHKDFKKLQKFENIQIISNITKVSIIKHTELINKNIAMS